ncbi:MAG: GH92 family glycosyl hydrolase [Pirellulales bacterium]|nr:GH92 family glycosyl hydrolase [Pirellulales bacterium]
MCRLLCGLLVPLVTVLTTVANHAAAAAEETKPLWKIGKADNDTAEFALAPDGYNRFGRDGLFVVGHSDASKTWPYCHPGPDDAWAGGSPHTFTILFGLAHKIEGDCRLVIDLVDTHGLKPPCLTVEVGGRLFRHQTPKGEGDASITGNPSAGREHRISIALGPLDAGLCTIRITNADLSWVLYDCVTLEVPASADAELAGGTFIQSVRAEPWLTRQGERLWQDVAVKLIHVGGPTEVVLQASGLASMPIQVKPGIGTAHLRLPPVETDTPVTVEMLCDGKTIDRGQTVRTPAVERQPVDWVDCLLGTSTSRWMLYPGPSTPFSMVKLSPDNQRQSWKAGYEYTILNIAGFSHLHSWTMGGLLTMPTVGELKVVPGTENDPDAGYRSRFSHQREVASPGYYAVTLDDYGVRAELTSTCRAGMQRYTFSKADQARILFDLLTPTEYGYTVHDARVVKVSDTEIEGYSKQQSGRHAPYNEFTLHFVARLDKPFRAMGGWVGEDIRQDVDEIAGKGDLGVFLSFSTEEDEIVQLKTGISLVSIEQARLNLDTEMGSFGWNFDAVRKQARQEWNELLGAIEVEGGTPDDMTKFYTNMYRSYCARTIWSDVNGKYVDMYEKVRQLEDPDSPVYGCDAFWNTFWNLNQLWTLVHPEVANQWVKSLLEISDRGGWLPKGPTGIEYSSIMVASHEIALIVSAYQKGIRNFDAEKAYRAMKFIQTEPGRPHEGGGHVGNMQLAPYMELGYVPVEKGPVSNTLEYAYDDWCVAQMAKALGKQDDYQYFMKRAQNYRNVFDASVGYMRQKHQDGRWVKEFSPFVGSGFVEGNSWQFTWFVPHDVVGLVELLGRERFNRRLDKGLADSAPSNFNATGDRFAEFPINHGNQPNMQSAWLFNYSGQPWLTQKWSREILERYYGTGPLDGWPGDEDQGQMGAWFVMAAMGLFEMDGGCSVRPLYEIGSPLFDRIVIHLDKRYYPGGQFVIEAKNNSKRNVYIQSATLNGKPLNKPWLYHSELVQGGKLVLEMGPEPNKQWGRGPEAVPPQNPE